MIIASAMEVYIESTDKRVILCGLRHGDIVIQLKLLGFEPNDGYKILSQGFIDHTNTFLDRKEAYQHALECGQLSSQIRMQKIDQINDYADTPELYSEDLW